MNPEQCRVTDLSYLGMPARENMRKIVSLLRRSVESQPEDWKIAFNSAADWLEGGTQHYQNFRSSSGEKQFCKSILQTITYAKGLGFNLSWDDYAKAHRFTLAIRPSTDEQSSLWAYNEMLRRMNDLLIHATT